MQKESLMLISVCSFRPMGDSDDDLDRRRRDKFRRERSDMERSREREERRRDDWPDRWELATILIVKLFVFNPERKIRQVQPEPTEAHLLHQTAAELLSQRGSCCHLVAICSSAVLCSSAGL